MVDFSSEPSSTRGHVKETVRKFEKTSADSFEAGLSSIVMRQSPEEAGEPLEEADICNPWAPKTMKNKGFGHLKTKLFIVIYLKNL